MKNRVTLLLIVCALLLGVNIGMLLSQRGMQLNVLPSVQAAAPFITADGKAIFTCSKDGTKLYRWANAHNSESDNNPLFAFQYSATAKP